MKFEINKCVWKIVELEKDNFYKTRKKIIEEEEEAIADEKYIFGFCCYSNHKIYLNKNQCNDEKKRTLIHELIHCWLWSYGASYTSYGEEALCDTVASSYGFIHEIVEKYFKTKRLRI